MKPIPYSRQEISDADVAAVVDILRSPFLTQGPAVELFEAEFAALHKGKHAVAVCNATAALHLACLALGVISATFGGLLRDVLRNEIPLVLRKEIYATACIIGGLALLGLDRLGLHEGVVLGITSTLVVVIRLLAIRYAIHQSTG